MWQIDPDPYDTRQQTEYLRGEKDSSTYTLCHASAKANNMYYIPDQSRGPYRAHEFVHMPNVKLYIQHAPPPPPSQPPLPPPPPSPRYPPAPPDQTYAFTVTYRLTLGGDIDSLWSPITGFFNETIFRDRVVDLVNKSYVTQDDVSVETERNYRRRLVAVSIDVTTRIRTPDGETGTEVYTTLTAYSKATVAEILTNAFQLESIGKTTLAAVVVNRPPSMPPMSPPEVPSYVSLVSLVVVPILIVVVIMNWQLIKRKRKALEEARKEAAKAAWEKVVLKHRSANMQVKALEGMKALPAQLANMRALKAQATAKVSPKPQDKYEIAESMNAESAKHEGLMLKRQRTPQVDIAAKRAMLEKAQAKLGESNKKLASVNEDVVLIKEEKYAMLDAMKLPPIEANYEGGAPAPATALPPIKRNNYTNADGSDASEALKQEPLRELVMEMRQEAGQLEVSPVRHGDSAPG